MFHVIYSKSYHCIGGLEKKSKKLLIISPSYHCIGGLEIVFERHPLLACSYHRRGGLENRIGGLEAQLASYHRRGGSEITVFIFNLHRVATENGKNNTLRNLVKYFQIPFSCLKNDRFIDSIFNHKKTKQISLACYFLCFL